MTKYKSNLNIFFLHRYLEDNIEPTSTLTLDDVSYDLVDAWEVIQEFFNETTKEIVCGIYASFDPYLDFYLVVLDGIPQTFKGELGRIEMEKFLQKNGYNYVESQESVESQNGN